MPKRHLVQDFDGDGEFDNYFHLKAMTINGVVDGNPRAYLTLNGSSNSSGNASASDENIGIITRSARDQLKYQSFIDHWYDNFPPERAARRGPSSVRSTRYAHVDMD